jgi:hypothetical protein
MLHVMMNQCQCVLVEESCTDRNSLVRVITIDDCSLIFQYDDEWPHAPNDVATVISHSMLAVTQINAKCQL